MATALRTFLVWSSGNGRGSIWVLNPVFFNLGSFYINTFASALDSSVKTVQRDMERVWRSEYTHTTQLPYCVPELPVCSLVSKLSFSPKLSISQLLGKLCIDGYYAWLLFLLCISDTWHSHFSVYIRHVFLAGYKGRICWDSFCLSLWLRNQKHISLDGWAGTCNTNA